MRFHHASRSVFLLMALTAPFSAAVRAAFPSPTPPPNAAETSPRTVANLKAAYRGESIAHLKYAAYAKQAEKEGFPDTALLFQAAAQAEAVHAQNHRGVLKEMGVKAPAPGTYTTTPGTTRENLMEAVKTESYERDTLYPRMLREAGDEQETEATRTLCFAWEAEKQHATLCTAALKMLKPAQTAAAYYVCPGCGATFRQQAPPFCTVCGGPQKDFVVLKQPAKVAGPAPLVHRPRSMAGNGTKPAPRTGM